MMRLAILTTLMFGLTLFSACESTEEKTDKVPTQDIDRAGAIETVVSTEHLDAQSDVLLTTHKIWKNNVLVQQTTHRDTLPALGKMTEESSTDTLRKDYEFYITVQ